MAVRQIDTTSRQLELTSNAPRPPRAMAWVVLLASAGAVLAIGVLATALVFTQLGAAPSAPWTFWLRLLGACVLTIASLSLRSLRWVFLLRRAETRIPIRDAYIGYFAGLSLLFAPFLMGEIAVRAIVHRARGRVPVLTTAVVNIWERAIDLAALGLIAGVAALLSGGFNSDVVSGFSRTGVGPYVVSGFSRTGIWYIATLVAIVSLVPAIRRALLDVLVRSLTPVARAFEPTPILVLERLASGKAWFTALGASVVAWILPGLGLWLLAAEWQPAVGLLSAERTYANSAIAGGVLLAPGGVLITGSEMLATLSAHGISGTSAALTVLGVRLATVGLSIALGVVFVLIHLRSTSAASASHFDDIADAYDVQIPESRRQALLERKTALMRSVIDARGVGHRGLDVGCGQGAYVGRMRALGFDVHGIDASVGQVLLAGRNAGDASVVQVGSVLDIPADDASFDFVYVINVLHHLASIDDQQRAFHELFRVLKPGGLLFVHEINTRNMLFRFYMGYVFPSLNCIDEGIERWLRPDRMAQYTKAPMIDVHYFTFLPDFVPRPVVRLLSPVERWLEGSALRVYSAHYLAVLEKAPHQDR